jgi:putative ABC transport system permease protein
VGEAQVEATRIASQLSDPDLKRGSLFLLLRSYRETLIEDFLPMLVLLGSVLACLLLVVCINVASLLAVEAMRSRKEMAIRFALGGTRWQIVRVFLLRVLALAGAGGVGGIGLAWFLVALICKVLPDGFPSADQIALKSQVLWFSAAVTVGTAIVSGVWPAMAATRSLHQFSGGENAHAVMTSSTARRRGHLVVLQLVFSGAFLVVTGMFGLSLQRLLSVDPGIQTDHRFVVVLRPADSTLKAPALNAFYSGIGSNLVGVPGVKATALSTNVPLGGHGTRDFRIKDRPEPKQPGEWLAEANAVDPNYFRVLGIPMRRGRSFDQQDGIGGRPVAIVNELFAGRFFRGESALGGQICLPSREGCVWREIVGVVADARDGRLDSPPQATCFVPFSQALGELSSAAAFTLQTEVGAAVVRESVQRRIGQLAPGAAIMASFTLDELRSIQTLAPRARLWILGAITVLSLLLTSLGVYGIMAGMVEQRRREIGVRMALGASRQEIAALFIRKMAFRLVPGLLIGMGGGAIAVRYLTTVLFETSPGNPVAYGAAASVLCVVAALATLMPVRRALQANPVDALRAE